MADILANFWALPYLGEVSCRIYFIEQPGLSVAASPQFAFYRETKPLFADVRAFRALRNADAEGALAYYGR
jgi:hypothetical protein